LSWIDCENSVTRLINISIIGIAILVALSLTEFVSRLILPISSGAQFLNLDGSLVSKLEADYYRYQPDLKYRQVSAEFDAVTTIDRFGNRVLTATGNPEVIFLGDSFTFGHGLSNKNTFAYIYCAELRIKCANLARPGLGTTEELDILEYYLNSYGWRPKTVKLVMLAMSGAMAAGNDLYDNYLNKKRRVDRKNRISTVQSADNIRHKESIVQDESQKHLQKFKNLVLENSNLARHVYFRLGHQIRALLSPPASKKILHIGLNETKKQLERFDELSRKFDFKTETYIIHPVQDLIRGTAPNTIQALKDVVPNQEFISSIGIFDENPRNYYFSYDGHWNTSGAEKFAEFLMQLPR
jgi:hypothetical protein